MGRARGADLTTDLVGRHAAFAARLEPGGRSSLGDDPARDRRLEIEALHGTVVRYGR